MSVLYIESIRTLQRLLADKPKRQEFSERLLATERKLNELIEECELQGLSKSSSMSGIRLCKKRCNILAKKIASREISAFFEVKEKVESIIKVLSESSPDTEIYNPDLENNVNLLNTIKPTSFSLKSPVQIFTAPFLVYINRPANPLLIKKLATLGIEFLPQLGAFVWKKGNILCLSKAKYNEKQFKSVISYILPQLRTKTKKDYSPIYDFLKQTSKYYLVLFVPNEYVSDFDMLQNMCSGYDFKVEFNA